MALSKLRYALGALPRRMLQRALCPSCGAADGERIDWKGFHELRECAACQLLFRFPYESSDEQSRFYQSDYAQRGLTTDLPDEATLGRLLQTNFEGTEKDFSRVIRLLRALAIPAGARILDFGANWGYGVHQFNRAGYSAVGFELSRSRASFSSKLGVVVLSGDEELRDRGPFDVVFSSHVLEHTPDPAEVIRRQLDLLVPGGFLIALTPNGSAQYRGASPRAFHLSWGQVHPVLITDRFLSAILPTSGRLFLGALSEADLRLVDGLHLADPPMGDLGQPELLCVYQRGH